MMRKETFYVIGIRHNPQLGSYLSKAIVAQGTYNKASITARFEEYGSAQAIRFCLEHDCSGKHYAASSTSCVYGSYSYYGYHSKEDAIAALKEWENAPGSSSERAKAGIAKFLAA